MTESEMRAVLLVRAAETASTAAWTEADATWASDAARRKVGERTTFDQWLVARARLALERLDERDPAFARAMRATTWRPWITWSVLALALAAGVLSDAIGPAHRINLLAPPLLGLLAWNIVVYVILVVRHFGRRSRPVAPDPSQRPLVAWLVALREHGRARLRSTSTSILRTYWHDWSNASRALYGFRVATLLHAGAAALVAGALLSLYARGLALEYRAGWESTFLDASDVRAVLARVLGAASFLSGIVLPSAERIAELRFSAGPGENAARWIHLYALTLGLAVLVPRALLAAAAWWQATRIAARFPLALDDPYLRRLELVRSGKPVEVEVLPYSYQLPDARRAAIPALLERIVAPRVVAHIAGALPAGAEDELDRWLVGTSPSPTRVALFALTATPERETHGAFVLALIARGSRDRVLVLVDESEFKRRFGATDLAARVAERRVAWQALLNETGLEPHFVDLGEHASESAPRIDTAASSPPH